MTKRYILMLLCVTLATAAFAQKKKKFEKYFYAETSKEAGPVTITITDAVATPEYIKFRFRVKNNTPDYILLKTDDLIMKVGDKEYKNTEKDLLIGPNDDDSRVVDIKGSEFRVDKFTVDLKGFSKVPAKSKSEDAENFKLPVAKNEFEAGPFKVVQLKNDKKTDLVVVKFNTMYNGDKIGIVNPGQASLLTPKGTEFANMGSRGQRKPVLLKKGQEDNFTLYWKDIPVSNGDMQFANIEIIWNDAFIEATPENLTLPSIEVSMDPGLTESKN